MPRLAFLAALALTPGTLLLCTPASAESALQRLFWNEQTKICVDTVKMVLAGDNQRIRKLDIERVETSKIKRIVKNEAPAVRISGRLDVEGTFNVNEEAVECVQANNAASAGQRASSAVPQRCQAILSKLTLETREHEALGFKLGQGRTSKTELKFACQFSTPEAHVIAEIEPLAKIGP